MKTEVDAIIAYRCNILVHLSKDWTQLLLSSDVNAADID
jgi:hypothetical protein